MCVCVLFVCMYVCEREKEKDSFCMCVEWVRVRMNVCLLGFKSSVFVACVYVVFMYVDV